MNIPKDFTGRNYFLHGINLFKEEWKNQLSNLKKRREIKELISQQEKLKAKLELSTL